MVRLRDSLELTRPLIDKLLELSLQVVDLVTEFAILGSELLIKLID